MGFSDKSLSMMNEGQVWIIGYFRDILGGKLLGLELSKQKLEVVSGSNGQGPVFCMKLCVDHIDSNFKIMAHKSKLFWAHEVAVL